MTPCMLHDTVDNSSSFTSPLGQRISYWTRVHTKTIHTPPLHVSYASAPYKIKNIPYIKMVAWFSKYHVERERVRCVQACVCTHSILTPPVIRKEKDA